VIFEMSFVRELNQTTRDMENLIIEDVHISRIAPGDTIMCNDGHMRTVCKKDIHRGGFCGDSVFGSSYNFGTIPVKRVKFAVPTNKGILYR
jgi:hypothetical protein